METTPYYATYGPDYDRLQPLRIEMYQTYHNLALDFLPFADDAPFRMLDLGCGTGTFMHSLYNPFPSATQKTP